MTGPLSRSDGPMTFEGRYELSSKLGEGGFGTVYKARQLSTGQPVALKVMRLPDMASAARIDKRTARFLREAQLCAKLQHPNIVQVLDSGQAADGNLYTVFAFVPGEDLATLLAREGALPPAQAQHLMLQVLDALTCAHAQGVIHRDLKPSNILVVDSGARRNAVVLDFGLGVMLDGSREEGPPRITGSAETLGTPGYSAPEQWRGVEPSARADLFSWGLVFLECLTGQPVYSGASAAELFYQQLGPSPVPVPVALEGHSLGELLRLATLKDAAPPPLTASELFAMLEACDLRGWTREAVVGLQPILKGSAPAPAGQSWHSQHEASAEKASISERRQITALVCKVSASAPGSKGDDAERLDEARSAALAICREAAELHDGQVVGVLGDRLLVYFGYPSPREDDALRAARAALHMVHALADQRARLEASEATVGVGIGVHTGLWSTGPTQSLGTASIALGSTPLLANEVATRASAGTILLTLAARSALRSPFQLAECEPPLNRDNAAPVELFHLLSERDALIQEASSDVSAAPLVGREHEVALLLDRWQRSCSVGGQCILITGEPGIGKSRLARELRERLPPESRTLIDGRCSPHAQGNALFPIIELLGRALGLDREREPAAKVARLEAQLTSHGFALNETVPLFLTLFSLPFEEPYRALEVSSPRLRTLTLDAISALLLGMAAQRPVLFLVEDLHWADSTTHELLNLLVREVPSAPICLLLTARPEYSPAFSSASVLQIPLGRLERTQIEAMANQLTGGKPLLSSALDQIVLRTDGVPLFVEELIRMLLESGALVEREAQFELQSPLSALEIPHTLRGLLGVRLDRVQQAKETAQLAATLGREFEIDVLTVASALGPAAVQEHLDQLVVAGLVQRGRRGKTRFGIFKHALVRDAAYESLGRAAREQAHAKVARALDERFPDLVRTRPDLLAYHHAAATQLAEATAYALRAAEQALGRCSYAEALTHATNVREWVSALAPSARTEVELVANGVLSQALMATRGWADSGVKATADRSAKLLQLLDEHSSLKVPTLWSLFAYHHTCSHRPAARATAEQLMNLAERSGDRGLQASAHTLLGVTLHPEGKFSDARSALNRAIALYDPEQHRDHGTRFGMDSLVLAKTLLAHLCWFSGDSNAALQLVASGIEWTREVGHVPSLAIGLLYGAQVQQFLGNKAAVRDMTEEILSMAAKHGLPAFEGYAAILHAWAVGDAERAQDIVAALEGMGCKLCLSYYGSLVADTLAERGELGASLARVDYCLSLCQQNDEHYYEAELHRRKAIYLTRQPRHDPLLVSASLERAIRLARDRDMTRIEFMALSELLRHSSSEPPSRARLTELTALHPELHDTRQ